MREFGIDPMQLIMALLLAGAVYGGIRADIKSIHANVRALHKSTKRAHKRIDRFYEERKVEHGCEKTGQ